MIRLQDRDLVALSWHKPKFRLSGGTDGHNNQRVGFSVAVPMMRVEEMILIEAEDAGMQSEGRGRQIRTDFATARDPNYIYGTQRSIWEYRDITFPKRGVVATPCRILGRRDGDI